MDVETTSLCARTGEIVELAICLFEFCRNSGEIVQVLDSYASLREPRAPITPGASQVHGLRAEDLRGRQLDHRRVEAMIHTAEFIVAHNAQFDQAFVAGLFPVSMHKPWLCSMSGIDWYGKGFRSRGLQNLLRDHDIHPPQAHRAESDVLAALLLLSRQGKDGRRYFLELLDKYFGQGKMILPTEA